MSEREENQEKPEQAIQNQPQGGKNAIILWLIVFLLLYLGPLYILYIGEVLWGGFQSRFEFVDNVARFVVADKSSQELFVRIIMPLLVGLTSGSILRGIISLPNLLLSTIFIISFVVSSLLLIELSNDDTQGLLNQRDLSANELKEFAVNMREALITSLTIILGISAVQSQTE